MNLIFLGSGGGRAMVYTQERKTSGFYLDLDIKMYVDPGVGSYLNYLTNFKDFFELKNLDYIFVSHAHIDHAQDLMPFVDYLTIGGKKKRRGVLLASYSVIKGGYFGPFINKTYLNYLADYEILDNGKEYLLKKGYKLKVLLNNHSDPTTFSFRLTNEEKGVDIGYISDTSYFEELKSFFKGVKVLVVNCLRPFGDKHSYHLTADQVLELLKDIKPKLTILHHLGFKFKGREIETIKRFKDNDLDVILSHEGLKVELENLRISYLLEKPYYYKDLIELYRESSLKKIKTNNQRKASNYEEKIKEMLMEIKKQLESNALPLNQTWVDKSFFSDKDKK